MELRPYQLQAIQEVRELISKGFKRIIVHAPTGAGKTVIASFIIKSAVKRNRGVIFLAHLRELIDQASQKLDSLDIWNGVIMANHPRNAPAIPVQVASVQTLSRRINQGAPPPASVIVVDECHRSTSDSYQKILDHYPDAIVIGLSATPKRKNGKGLGEFYEKNVTVSSIKKLTDEGYLVPSRVFSVDKPNLDAVKLIGGDYNEKELAQIMSRPDLVGDLVENYRKYGENRLAVVFAVNINHSKLIRDLFLKAEIKAAHVDGSDQSEKGKAERHRMLDAFSRGEIQVVSNVGILTEGWDCPPASCGIIARPTRSENLYLQMVGRFLRPHPGKKYAMILDHGGCVYEHGMPDEERDYSLDATPKRRIKKGRGSVVRFVRCRRCFATNEMGVDECVHCGNQLPKQKVRKISHDQGGQLKEVKEVDRDGRMVMKAVQAHQELTIIAEQRGYKKGWVWVQMNMRFSKSVVAGMRKIFKKRKAA